MTICIVHEVTYDCYRFEEVKHVASTPRKARAWCKKNCPSEAGAPYEYNRELSHTTESPNHRHYWIERRKVDA
jgi:hypothetical protein